MILVTSAAYINEELQSEFGKIPPSFLPLQNKRLFEHQIKLLHGTGEKIFYSLPDTFIVNNHDRLIFEKFGVDIIYIDAKSTLRDSILIALQTIDNFEDSLLILHGDTLFSYLPKKTDSVFASYSQDNYNWGRVANVDKELIYSGLFSFSNQSYFLDCLLTSNSFIESIENYDLKYKLNFDFIEQWFDLGHLNTYFRSKSKFTTQRIFNDLKISNQSVKKFSSNKNKIEAEFNWFYTLPKELKYYLPILIGRCEDQKKQGYEIEYIYLNTLNELFVFGNNNYLIWKKIFGSCFEFLKAVSKYQIVNHDLSFSEILFQKTNQRLKIFSEYENIQLDKEWLFNGKDIPCLNQISTYCISLISNYDFKTIIHGDFCFSNIFYDFRKQSIKVIDPRGLDFDDNLSIYGDLRYDIAKLMHSVVGLYDFIIAERYGLNYDIENYSLDFTIEINNDTIEIQKLLIEGLSNEFDFDINEILAITVHLFLSMLPLHHDNKGRQIALLANSFRIYELIKK